MVYTDLIRLATKIAFNAHKGQVDKAGIPYICHPLHVAEYMADEVSTCVAFLHDVCEDSRLTLTDLEQEGIPDEALEAIKLLTKSKEETYQEYILKIRENKVAVKVKIQDLRHNMDLSRIPKVTAKDIRRIEKYKQSLDILETY